MHSDGLQVNGGNGITTANLELIPEDVVTVHGVIDYSYNNFSFYNKEDCSIRVNGGDNIFLYAGQGFDYKGKRLIYSFIVVTSGVTYNWIGSVD